MKRLKAADHAKTYENVVYIENLSSNEYFQKNGEEAAPVLRDISLSVKKGQCWGINGDSLFSIKILLEIISNIRPYKDGKCSLLEMGMMRSKRVILPHVFYIGSPGMVYNNMNVLEFLMFATANSKTDKVLQQEQIFESLINIGLKKISMSPVRSLTKEQKAVIILLTAAYSSSDFAVFNLPEYSFDDALTGAMSKIAKFMSKKGKTLLIGTQSPDLIETVCTHTAYIVNGVSAYTGTVGEFKKKYDRIMMKISDKNAADLAKKLCTMLPEYDFSVDEDIITVRNYSEEEDNVRLVYEKIAETGFAPEKVKLNPKRVKYACEEIKRQYDLQK
ncbi:MAG: hypothetical protein Q8878_03150 [Bacillota bacterium]|nr:hypothetical protein [Bacillota bacterium]